RGPRPAPVSLAPGAGRDGALRLAAYGGLFLLALQHGRSSRRAERVLMAVAATGSGLALYGLAVHFSGSATILWWDKWAYRDVVTATFVNRNSYATFAGLTLLSLTALAWRRYGGLDLRGLLRRLLVDGDRLCWALLAGAGLTALSLLLTGSRAGCGAALAGATVFVLGLRRFSGLRLAALALCLAAGVPLLFWLVGGMGDGLETTVRTAGDLGGQGELADRMALYRATLSAVATVPWTGTGLGSFPAVFAMVRPERFLAVWDNVHDTYLQLVLESGVIAAGAQILAVLLLVRRCLQGVRHRRHDLVFPVLAVAASVLVGGHALVDFSLEIPAVAALYAVLLGLGVAQSWRGTDPTGDR
ncbi:MAG: O-antigen ligase family protein, partial [Telmatospirillum sp.]|nr:O-antigen ligase family protein [Telmatospirillum sp.]